MLITPVKMPYKQNTIKDPICQIFRKNIYFRKNYSGFEDKGGGPLSFSDRGKREEEESFESDSGSAEQKSPRCIGGF